MIAWLDIPAAERSVIAACATYDLDRNLYIAANRLATLRRMRDPGDEHEAEIAACAALVDLLTRSLAAATALAVD